MTSYATPDIHLYIHTPTPLFKARANHPAAVTYPITSITFDTVTLGAYTDLAFDMLLTLGSTDGGDDYGRVRVQKVATSTAIPVARVSQGAEDGTLTITDNAYITVWDAYPIYAKLPYQDPNGQDFKDGDVPVLDYLVEIPPVVVMGAGFANYTTGGIITVSFDGSLSYAMPDGATITGYAWSVKDGTLTAGTLTSASITATFPAGFRWVELTVTDSNGVVNTSRRPVLAVNAAADVTIPTAQVEGQRFTQQGQTLRVKFPADLLRTTYPDGTLAMLWWDAPSSSSDRSHMKFIGWLQSEDAALHAQKQGLVRETTLEFVDVAGRLDSLPGFPQALQREDEDDVDEMWSLMPDLDINKALHYLIFWHSTALGVADFFLPSQGTDYPSMRLDSTGATLYDQINSRALSLTPDHILSCNSQGQLSVMEDWMTMDVGDRPTIAAILTEDDYSDISIPYARPPRVHVLRSSAVVTSTDWVMLGGEKTLPLAFSIAPGEAFSQGTSEQTEAEGLTQSQAQLNMVTGHRYARLNARFGPVRVHLLNPTAIWDYVPALMNRIQLNIGAEYAAQRGLPFTTTQAMCKELNIRYNSGKQGLAIEAEATLELETSGPPAVTHVPETEGDPDDYETPPIPPPTVPPGSGLEDGVQMVAAIGIDGYVYKTSDFQTASGSGGPTWTRTNLTIAATIYSWVVDPFSPGYIDGVGTINGWIVNDTNIYRVTDLFGTPAKTSVFTFPTVTVGASFHWRSIQASFGAYFGAGANPWLACVSYYGDTVGHTGTWCTYSTDGGVTWAAEVQISADYDATAAVRFNPIGVYLSPKTPGLAYTIAHVGSASGPLPRFGTRANGGSFVDEGLGATYSQVVGYEAPPTGSSTTVVFIGPPADAARMVVEGDWTATITREGPSGGVGGGSLELGDPASVARTDDLAYVPPVFGDPPVTGSFTAEYTFAGADWPGNRDSMLTSPPTGDSNGVNLEIRANAQSTGAAGVVENIINVTLRVTEIELDDATVYNPSSSVCALFKTVDWGANWVEVDGFIEPGDGMGGSIHIPWPLNAAETLAFYGHYDDAAFHQFRLKKTDAGVITDISPVSGGVSYGVFGGSFGIRAYDSDRNYLALGGFGNDTTASTAGDLVGLWVSSNAGSAWVNILAPAAVANAPRGLQIAFGGDDSDILFAWGGKSDGTLGSIYYSSDLGATLDSREGNMNSLGVTTIIGIAGGIS